MYFVLSCLLYSSKGYILCTTQNRNSCKLNHTHVAVCALLSNCPHSCFLNQLILTCGSSFIQVLSFQIPQFSSVTQLCTTLCDPIDCSTPGFPVHCQLPELPQTHVHRVGDAVQLSHLLSSPSAFNLSQTRVLCLPQSVEID